MPFRAARPGAGDDAPLHEVHHALGQHLGVDAEPVVAGERRQRGVGDGADAELQGGAVRHHFGY